MILLEAKLKQRLETPLPDVQKEYNEMQARYEAEVKPKGIQEQIEVINRIKDTYLSQRPAQTDDESGSQRS